MDFAIAAAVGSHGASFEEIARAEERYQERYRLMCGYSLQNVLDTGEPVGARSPAIGEYECYESSAVEQPDGLPLMTCWTLINGQRDQVVLEANLR